MIPTREQPALQSPARRRGQASSHQPVGGTNPRANGHHPYPTPVAIGQHAPIPASGPERSAHFGSPRGPEKHLSKMRWKMPRPTTTMSTFAIGRRFMPEAEGRPVSPDCRPTLRAAVSPLIDTWCSSKDRSPAEDESTSTAKHPILPTRKWCTGLPLVRPNNR